MSKVLVAVSGGVDSSVTLALLKSKGFRIHAVMLKLYEGMEESIAAALKVCKSLGVSFEVINDKSAFDNEVVSYFIDSYLCAMTPNPCVRCNRKIKFATLFSYAMKNGFDYIATGHYAKIEKDDESGNYLLKASVADKKDQTYFLYGLNQKILSKTLMPLGEYSKTQVRNIANEMGLSVAEKKDSQEICFIENNDYAAFIEKTLKKPLKKGYFVDTSGKRLGKHKGIIYYTIGQRKGLGIALGKPAYVTDINSKKNEVVLGDREECMKKRIVILKPKEMFEGALIDGRKVLCKIRSSMKAQKATIYLKDGMWEVDFDNKVWAPSSGQSAVFYTMDMIVLGGGIIK